MDICPSDDLAVNFGTQILRSKKDSVFDKPSGKAQQYGGLFLGKRQVVVVSVDGGQERTPVKVYDHGEQQKEATRRLFEAHVYTKAYQKDALEKSANIEDLNHKLLNAGQQINEMKANRVDRTPVNDGFDLAALNASNPIEIKGWLRNDQHSRELVSHFVKKLGNSETDRQELTDQFWTLLQAGVNRWNGDPNPEVVKQAQAAEQRSREVLAKALKESSELRHHFNELQNRNHELATQHQQMTRQLSSIGARFSASPRASPCSSPRSFGLHGSPEKGARSASKRDPSFPSPLITSEGSTPIRKVTMAAKALTGVTARGKSKDVVALAKAKDDHVFEAVAWGSERSDINVSNEVMERIDHEVFEPLSLFDADMTKLMEEMVTEKVKRIMSLDPEKWQNRLPYGLKQEISDDEHIKQLMEENRLLMEKNKKLAQQLKDLKELMESLRKKLEVAEKVVADSQKQQEVETAPEVIHKERGSQCDPPKLEKTWKEDEVQAAIKAAVDKATEEFNKQRAELEDLIKKLRAELEAAKKEAAEERKKASALQAQLDKLQSEREKDREEMARLKAELKRVQRELDATQEELLLAKQELESARASANKDVPREKETVYVEKIVEKEKTIVQDNPEAIMALSNSQAMLQRLCESMSAAAGIKSRKGPGRHSEEINARHRRHSDMIQSHIGRDRDDQDFHSLALGSPDNLSDLSTYTNAMPVFANWCDDLASFFSSKGEALTPSTTRSSLHDAEITVQQVEIEKIVEVPSKAQQEEMEKLRQKCREQQEEISRLLLMIEEMRHRLESLQFLLEEKGYTDETLQAALEKVGLQDLMDAKKKHDLANVYERLYQDALQRMQRSALTLEQRIEASKLYYAGIASNKKRKNSIINAPPPQLDQLTDAARAAVHGMWYHYDILFKRVCERSAEDALKNSAINKYRLALADLFGDALSEGNFNDLGSLFLPGGVVSVDQDEQGANKRKIEPFADRRIISSSPGVVSPGGGIAFGRQRQRPQSVPMGQQREPPSSFKAFMSQQSGVARSPPSEEVRKANIERPRSSIGALTQKGKQRAAASSQSLPALPKGLANLKSASNASDLPNSAATHRTSFAAFASTASGGLTSGESSMVLQDSYMSAAS